ncbi:TetR/AcrR family transcriptional regulator [Mesorhizobium sp. VK25A]|uniref:TetR/AcrR family transcriptional regulator n=1 Tax=Mesorhizobium vachelliae TaxID=3072309 RepID=A0ABU5A605_9HYPH|nr:MULTISPECIES: TetR/AcrR family transcriptional regulator [unclassified Mesorhizobium]MDX8533090.1 TetR/AcrR family transcriptional regulator [Mesorhizobium sp. VK25D]MDX8545009.1 TetR/AcrR family transcriptional regulator [Mesorhizobium sp. VK25A]
MASAPKQRQIQDIRKGELIVATLNSIRKHGYLNSTISTIAEESGLSRGLVGHYFGNKDDLLILAHKYYLQNIDDFFRHVVVSTKTGHFGKLMNSVFVPFLRDTGYQRMMIHYLSAAWILPDVLAMHRDLWGRYRANIERRITAVARERGIVLDTRLAAIALTQLGDGLWYGWVMEESYTREDCRTILRQWLCQQFGEDPAKYPLTPDFDLEHYETSAPLPKPE